MAWTEIPVGRLVQRVVLVVLTILALLAVVWLLLKLWSLLVLAGLALLLGTALLPAVGGVARVTRRRTLAVVLVLLGVLAALALFGWLVLPPMVTQGRDLVDRAPERQERLAQFTDDRGWSAASERIRTARVSDYARGDLVVRTGLSVIGGVVAGFSVFFLTLYFLLDTAHLERFVYFSTPRTWHRHIRALLPSVRGVVGAFVRGQAITSAAIGVFTFGLLTILGVPNALALAGIAMVVDLIPLVGVFLLIGVTVLAALAVSPTAAVVVFGAMLVYQQFEDRLLVPRIYGSTLRLPTIVVVVALLVGAQLLGILGALVALPIAAAIRVVVVYAAAARRAGPAVAERAR